ncbi:MAG: tRNA guanosine(34) transglycosylase Tgt [Elusimicrobiota bacterium]
MSGQPAFEVTAKDRASRARTGTLRTEHGRVETPVFMPVATQGSVKALSSQDLSDLGIHAILSNAYHLALRPGADVIEAAGGLNAFMDYPGTILTDSGGYQIFSLADLRRLSDDGVTFQSHIDGSLHTLTPEGVIGLQARLGSDIWTSLDECPAYPCTEAEARRALERTMRWTERSHRAFTQENGKKALFFPVIQGSVYPELRRRACEHLLEIRPDGVSLGGFSVGEPKEKTWEALERTVERLPDGMPRYLMGMGAPDDLWEAVRLGVDMLDCVWPTRTARNGVVMTAAGRLNIKNAPMRKDFSPLDKECDCATCGRYSRAYLSHLFRARELSAYRLLSVHNLHFSLRIMRRIRAAIREGRFLEERKLFLERYRGDARVPPPRGGTRK